MILILTIARAGGWQRDTGSVMDPLIKINAVLRDSRDALHQLWRHFVSIANVGTGVLGHPHYIPRFGRSKVIYQRPIYQCGTASYDDVEKLLRRIHDFHVRDRRQSLVYVVGDQQTYDRMLKLKIRNPEPYRWLLPLPGEFHFKWHVTLAILPGRLEAFRELTAEMVEFSSKEPGTLIYVRLPPPPAPKGHVFFT